MLVRLNLVYKEGANTLYINPETIIALFPITQRENGASMETTRIEWGHSSMISMTVVMGTPDDVLFEIARQKEEAERPQAG